MGRLDLSGMTGALAREWYGWLRAQRSGCCSLRFASTDGRVYFVCMGWHYVGDGRGDDGDGYAVCWKIGRQSPSCAMWCDFDLDFEMPYDPVTGDVDDTVEEVVCRRIGRGPSSRWSVPEGCRGWDALAARMRKAARRVFRDWERNGGD